VTGSTAPVTWAAETIPELFERALEHAPDATWLRSEDATYTYREAHERIAAIAGALRDEGVGPRTRIMATTRNSPEYLFVWLASAYLGSMLLTVNPASTEAELAGYAIQFEPEMIVTDEALEERLQTGVAGPDSVARTLRAEDLAKATFEGDVSPDVAADDVAVLIPTSGTTGRSKLVMQTQRAYAMAGQGFPFWLALTESDRLMTSLPLFHVNAPSYSVMGSIAAGAGLILLPRFSGSRFIEWARDHGATEFNAIGAMLEILMRQPERSDDADNPLRLCYTGPSPSKKRQLEIEERFGLKIVCGYALSESPYGLIWKHGTRPFETLGSVRQHPTLGVINHARVRDEGRAVDAGEVGELELKNPVIMRGYYNMPEETAKVISGGWLQTGDLVQVNSDDTFTFVGRKKELIRRRGENMSPVEIEMVLETHPAVAEAVVIGVPSDLSEEDVKAFVVLTGDGAITLEELRDYVAERLAPFKVPRYFEAVSELPHTATGRIAKHKLPRGRSEAEADLDPQPREQTGQRS
jgi:carnitine-CoA ligase